MIDLSKLKAPGWQRVVDELSKPAPDDQAYLSRLLAVLTQVASARQVVLWSTGGAPSGDDALVEPRPLMVWPPAADGSVRVEVKVEDEAHVRRAARDGATSRSTRVFGLEADDSFYDEARTGFVIALPVPGSIPPEGPAAETISLLLDHRSTGALQTTLALIEVIAGYVHIHRANQKLARAQASSAAMDLATRLIASINQVKGYKGATLQLCNDLTRQLGLDRAALGWVRGIGSESGRLRVVAMSDTEHIDQRMAMVRKIASAMEECYDQAQAVLHPPPPETGDGPEADVVLAQAITHAHRELASSDARLRCASIPLRADDEVVGVLTVEAGGDESVLGVRLVEWLQATMDLVAPVLSVRRSDSRMLPLRALDSLARAGGWIVGPKHTVWKLAGLGLLALALVVAFVRVSYKIEAPVELRPSVQRIVSAPFDGVIERLGEGIEKGVTVEAGQVLVHLRTTELTLAAEQARTKMIQAQTRADAALRQGKAAQAQQAQAEVDSGRAQLQLYEHRIEHATVRAPIAGVIVDGDLKQRIGSTISLGEPLFIVAQLDSLEAIAQIDDRDISFVRVGTRGALARKSRPGERIPIIIERIVPQAMPRDGANTFEARAIIDWDAMTPDEADAVLASLRPGMEGLIKFDTGQRTIAWVLSRRIRDTLEVWLWW